MWTSLVDLKKGKMPSNIHVWMEMHDQYEAELNKLEKGGEWGWLQDLDASIKCEACRLAVEHMYFSATSLQALGAIEVPSRDMELRGVQAGRYNKTLRSTLQKSCDSESFRRVESSAGGVKIKGASAPNERVSGVGASYSASMRRACTTLTTSAESREHVVGAALEVHRELDLYTIAGGAGSDFGKVVSTSQGRIFVLDTFDRVCVNGTQLCPVRPQVFNPEQTCSHCKAIVLDLEMKRHRMSPPAPPDLDTVCEDLLHRHGDFPDLRDLCETLVEDQEEGLRDTLALIGQQSSETLAGTTEKVLLKFCGKAGLCKKKEKKDKKSSKKGSKGTSKAKKGEL